MDFTLYWFMFPVPICVATCAMLSGIGGAALLIAAYAMLVFVLAIGMLFLRRRQASRPYYDNPDHAPEIPTRDFVLAGVGAFLTGLVSVGNGAL